MQESITGKPKSEAVATGKVAVLRNNVAAQVPFETRLRSHMDTYGWSNGDSGRNADAYWESLHKSGSTEHNSRTAYIHVPFCSTLCSFCNFQRKVGTPAAAAEYAKVLIQELQWYRKSAYVAQGGFTSLYLGGGTPSLIPADELAQLIKYVRQTLWLNDQAEITMESTIHDLTSDKLKTLAEAGVNRISFGVQTFDTALRKRLGRLSDRQKVCDTIASARQAGIKTLSADILYRLPGQTPDEFIDDLKIAVGLGLDGVSIYPLIVMDGTPLKKALHERRSAELPDIEAEHSSYQSARDYLRSAGYRHDTCTHFALPTDRNLYSGARLDDGDCLPIGSGAGGYVGPLVVMNSMDRVAYQQQISQGKSGYMASSLLTPKARVIRSITGQLQKGFLFQELVWNDGDVNLKEIIHKRAEDYVHRKLLLPVDQGYRLTDEGWFWCYNIAADFANPDKNASPQQEPKTEVSVVSEANSLFPDQPDAQPKQRERKLFSLKQLSVIGVLCALVIVVQFIAAIILHAVGIAAIPGAMYFATSLVSSVILFVALRKVPKAGALSIIAGVYSILIMLITGNLFMGAGLLLGGVLGDITAKVLGGIQKTVPLIAALVVYRTCETSLRNVFAVVTSVTQVHWVWYLIVLSVVASAIGALVGGFVGSSLSNKLLKAGVMS